MSTLKRQPLSEKSISNIENIPVKPSKAPVKPVSRRNSSRRLTSPIQPLAELVVSQIGNNNNPNLNSNRPLCSRKNSPRNRRGPKNKPKNTPQVPEYEDEKTKIDLLNDQIAKLRSEKSSLKNLHKKQLKQKLKENDNLTNIIESQWSEIDNLKSFNVNLEQKVVDKTLEKDKYKTLFDRVNQYHEENKKEGEKIAKVLAEKKKRLAKVNKVMNDAGKVEMGVQAGSSTVGTCEIGVECDFQDFSGKFVDKKQKKAKFFAIWKRIFN